MGAGANAPAGAAPPFEVRLISARRGHGMFALRPLPAGTLILRERPLLVMPDAVFQLDDMDRLERWLERQLDKLTSDDRQTFYALSDCRTAYVSGSGSGSSGSSSSEGEATMDKTAMGIFFTNDMTFAGDAALFPTMARANHACVPTADFVTREAMGVQDLVAVRDIAAGEEITLSYLPAADTGSDVRKVRQDYVREWYGFQCQCNTCNLEPEALALDEQLRRSVRAVQTSSSSSSSSDADAAFAPRASLAELESFLDNLTRIGCKLPYFQTASRLVFERAVKDNDVKLAAKVFAAGYVADSVVGLDADHVDQAENEWAFVLRSQMVTVDGQGYLFAQLN